MWYTAGSGRSSASCCAARARAGVTGDAAHEGDGDAEPILTGQAFNDGVRLDVGVDEDPKGKCDVEDEDGIGR